VITVHCREKWKMELRGGFGIEAEQCCVASRDIDSLWWGESFTAEYA
jgi:hypothetical protein